MTERGPRDAQPFRRLREAPFFSNRQEFRQHDLREINDAASRITIQGARLPEAVLKLTDQ